MTKTNASRQSRLDGKGAILSYRKPCRKMPAILEIKLINVGKLMARCWNDSENSVRELIRAKHPAPAEEHVTFLFEGEFRAAVDRASSKREVERAFLADLRRVVPTLPYKIAQRASGLVARVNLHNRWHEGNISASDFGLVISRPIVRIMPDRARIEFRRNHATGLLAQAKLGVLTKTKQGKRKWDGLTNAQQRLYRKRRDYYSLLLYRLDGDKLNDLQSFGWQVCKPYTIKQVKDWLRTDAFPEEKSSSDLLGNLFARTIGTSDPKIIETIIDPPASHIHSLDLQIFWPDGSGPPPSIGLQVEMQQQKQVQACQ